MSYKRAIEQLRPVRIPKEDVQEKTQRYLHESKGPSGAQWEALIAIAVNKIKNKKWNSGPEWDDVGKFWGEYETQSMKLGKDFIDKLGVTELKQLGGSTANTNPEWKGSDKTPKTDIIGKDKKISLKKASGSQLMSAGQDEAISTFEAAMSMYSMDSKGKQKINSISLKSNYSNKLFLFH